MAAKLVVQDLQKRFGDQEVLRGASFTFEQGKIYGLIGRNGAGKTTFFNCLNEDLTADGGSFHLEDDTGAARPVTADDMGYVLSTPVVPEFLTAREFLQFFLEINRGKIPYPKAPDVYLDYMCIDPADRGKLLKDFSHGMKNKMQMLVNIMADPAVLLLDEPAAADQDPAHHSVVHPHHGPGPGPVRRHRHPAPWGPAGGAAGGPGR